MTPARLSSLRGMALQCSRTHDQDVQGLKVVSRHQPGFTAVAGGAITGATGCRVGCTVEPPPPSTLHPLFPAHHLRQHRQVGFNIGPPTPAGMAPSRRAPHMVAAAIGTNAGGGHRTASARR